MHLKGQSKEMNNFLEVLQNKSVLSAYAPMVLNFFAALIWRKWKIKSWLASLKTLTNLTILAATFVKEFRNQPVTVCKSRSALTTRIWKGSYDS
jgi:hypothetical protein